MWREVYMRLLSPEIFVDPENVRTLCGKGETQGSCEGELVALKEEVRLFREEFSRVFDISSLSQARILELLFAQTAPYAACFGMPLSRWTFPASFENPFHLETLKLFADDVGVGYVGKSRYDAYRHIAREFGFTKVSGPLAEIATERAIRDRMFQLPALIFALTRGSDAFLYELLGLDLALRTVGFLPFWGCLSSVLPSKFWSRLDCSIAQGPDLIEKKDSWGAAFKLCQKASTCEEIAEKISFGISLFRLNFKNFNRTLLTFVSALSSPRYEMALLVQERAREASVYHGRFKLQGKTLRDWMKESVTDPLPFVDALAKSPLISPKDPQESYLLKISRAADGAMFRIFSEDDLEIIMRWICALNDLPKDQEPTEKPSISLAELFSASVQPWALKEGDMNIGVYPTSIREAYALLLGRSIPPKTRSFCEEYIDFWLDRAEASIDQRTSSLPPLWEPGNLREWLQQAHEKSGQTFEEGQTEHLPTREQVIDQTLQLSPLTLIDGAWLQGMTEPVLASSPFGAPLFKTYWDELGNGEWSINHPKIYRDVLQEMGVHLEALSHPEFASSSLLRDESFYLPVFWLCIGKLPISFTPEILGLNLAMELSGVGGGYRSAHRFLKHYRFSTLFVDLHNTIDNVATGHSAWAADAIDAYVQEARHYGDLDKIWHRVRCGYEALAPFVSDSKELCFFSQKKKITSRLREKLFA